ncbi:hypothetical protein FM038_013150 [Shewanella eurypsychrophilus]|uniref:Phage protein n=1 Tax=Shewanella eurypsychrophilus TaxID=2593656 RepID=A0ABX6V6Q8_9GAMM|nr:MULTISPECIES: hypothetical protein [Shewanella]QFU23002.1 hypothetical protein FS418_14735 [Shewanella sp. YLB-09]QPG58288.1 hypothetical protein FM038_013150 [Shewanella eurypsychrophilus]
MKLYRPQLMASVKRMAAREARASGVLALAAAQGISEGEAAKLWLSIHHRVVRNRAAKRMKRRMRAHSIGSTKGMEKEAFVSPVVRALGSAVGKRNKRVASLTSAAKGIYNKMPNSDRKALKGAVAAIDTAATAALVSKVNQLTKIAHRPDRGEGITPIRVIPRRKTEEDIGWTFDANTCKFYSGVTGKLGKEIDLEKTAFIAGLARAGAKMLKKPPKVPKLAKNLGGALATGAAMEVGARAVPQAA